MNENTPAEAGAGELVRLAKALGTISGEFGEWTVDVQRQNEIAVVLAAAADVLRAHRCSPSVVPGDTATEGGDGFMAWLDTQIVDAEGARAEVAEDFPDAVGVNDADLAYARERAFREVRERFAAAGVLATAGTEGEGVSPQQGTLRITNGYVEEWTGACTCGGEAPVPPYQHEAHCGWEMLDQLASAASPQGEAQGQGEDEPELWWSPSGGVLRSAPDGAWRMRLGPEPAAPVPDDAVRLVAAPRAVAPVGNEHEDAKALLVEIGTEVLGLTRGQVIEDPRLVRDYAAKAVGSRNMANATLKRRAEGLRAALGAPEDTPWPQLIARVQAPVGNVDRETLVERLRTVIEWVSARDHARAIELDEVVHELETLAALRGDR